MPAEDEQFQKALDCHREGNLREAAAFYQAVLAANPRQTDALYLLGVVANQTGNFAQAVALQRRALELAPDDARCYNELGLAFNQLGRHEDAEASFRQAIALDPDYANAHYNLGNALRERNLIEPAAGCFDRALAVEPEHARALVALGQVLQALARPADAVPVLERALRQIDDDPELYCDLGDALQTLRQFPAAVVQYRKALERNPRLARAWYAAGCAESSRQEHAAASFCFSRAVECGAANREAHHNLGHSLFKLGQIGDALRHFRLAATEGDPQEAEAAIAVAIPGDPASSQGDILDARRHWAERYLPAPRPRTRTRSASGPLRVGYVSSFFQDHNWMKPVWGLIHQHDRAQFEVHLFSDAPPSAIRQGYRPHPGDRFHDITGLTADTAADLVEQAAIDVLVDLNGYSTLDRLPLFALRPAPRIAGWFNIFATTGMSAYDCLVGDDTVIPPAEEQFYTEPVVRVPGSYLTFEVGYAVPDAAPSPCGASDAITFGSLAPLYKITPEVVRAWSTVLAQTPGSSLVLKNSAFASAANRQYVEACFAACDIAPDRLRIEGPADHYRFLETYGRIDVALDTFPYNGGTTTTEAIWQGVPVVAFYGDRWVARTSASILRAGGLGEFVAEGVEDYIALAVRLAGERDRLAALRREMRERLRASPVCDTRAFARHMERIYRGES